jgi:hypothetical protein
MPSDWAYKQSPCAHVNATEDEQGVGLLTPQTTICGLLMTLNSLGADANVATHEPGATCSIDTTPSAGSCVCWLGSPIAGSVATTAAATMAAIPTVAAVAIHAFLREIIWVPLP